VLGLSALCALALACERPVPRAEISERVATLERPNIVLILIDMLRADRTTPYGFELDTSPQLRRWADRGVLFERVLAQSSWTKMSVASLMTSLWPRSHGITEPGDGLADGAVTLAEILKEQGYQTFGIQTNGWLHASFGFQQGFDRYVFPFGKGAKLPHSQIWPHVDRVVDEAARLIDARDPDTPFFLYLHFMDVHEYAAPPEFRSFGTDTEANYHAAIRWVDDGLERVYAKLDDAGVLGDTLIVLGSDHGETFGENGKHGHARNVLSAVLHVPLVIRFPFPIEPVRIPVQVRNLDVAPTLLDIAGVPIPESFEGRSLLPLVTGAGDGDLTSFAGLGLPLYRDASVQISVTDGSWTFARNVEPDPNRDEFLYDRSVDPGENANLLGREPAQEQRMRKLLDDHVSEEPSAEVMESDVRIDPGIAQRLRAMGYLQ
jgi:arylsulfatase A-like enzyme